MMERQGMQIDYCPQCRGIWLEKGKLDKIIERATAEIRSTTTHHAYDAPSYPQHDEHHDKHHDKHHDDHHDGHRRKHSFLRDLFD